MINQAKYIKCHPNCVVNLKCFLENHTSKPLRYWYWLHATKLYVHPCMSDTCPQGTSQSFCLEIWHVLLGSPWRYWDSDWHWSIAYLLISHLQVTCFWPDYFQSPTAVPKSNFYTKQHVVFTEKHISTPTPIRFLFFLRNCYEMTENIPKLAWYLSILL